MKILKNSTSGSERRHVPPDTAAGFSEPYAHSAETLRELCGRCLIYNKYL